MRRWRVGRRSGALLVGGLMVATSLAGTSETRAGNQAVPPRRPDLVVTAGVLKARVRPGVYGFYGFGGRSTLFSWFHQTENIGTAPARSSLTSLELHAGESGVTRTLDVPRLEPGGIKRSRFSTFTRRLDPDVWSYGTYKTRICADKLEVVVEGEKSEKNNCWDAHPFFVVPTALQGLVTGKARFIPPFSGSQGVWLSWAGTITFSVFPLFQASSNDFGGFVYRPASGHLTYTLSGKDSSGCTWYGTGTYTPPTDGGEIILDFGDAKYSADSFVPPTYHFPYTTHCPDGSSAGEFIPNHLSTQWITSGLSQPHRPFPDPGLKWLDAGAAYPFGNFPANWHWNLQALPAATAGG